MTGTERPVATYRVQLRDGVDFATVESLLDHLGALGVSHVYLSPPWTAVAGSTHGYDVVDPNGIDPAIGGTAGFEALADAARAAGVGIVADIVPNHLATDPANRWWWQVLERGSACEEADVFDIDWSPSEDRLRNRIVVPVLGDHLGRVIASDEIQLARVGHRIEIRYFDHRFPTAPRSQAGLLRAAAERLDGDAADRFAFLADALEAIEPAASVQRADRAVRSRNLDVLAALLAEALQLDGAGDALDDAIAAVQADADRLLEFLDRQHHRLSFWRAGNTQLDYRRFFDIDTLIGVRQEDPFTFDLTHRRIVAEVAAGRLQGLRVDHPDGLRDPAGYFARLRTVAPDAWIVGEKILEGDEALPPWPIDGTTGYDAARLVGGVLVDPAAADALAAVPAQLGADVEPLHEAVARGKRQILDELLIADHRRVTEALVQVCEATPSFRDYTRAELHEVIGDLAVALDRYRTYVTPTGASAEDVAVIDQTAAQVAGTGAHDPDLVAFFADVLAGRRHPAGGDELVARFQQLTGPVMAKGAEDTAFYRDPRLVSLCEVGAGPDPFGLGVEDFHAGFARRQQAWPSAMTALTTHDTKRSADVRARLAVLADRPAEWAEVARSVVAALPVELDPTTALILAQTVVGAHPISAERMETFATKAVREAKRYTSWTAPDEDYEARAVAAARFLAGSSELARFAESIAPAGRATAIAQLVLACTVPGVPDVYQGDEGWNLVLVDPDNRRPVDWAAHQNALAGERVAATDPSGAGKTQLLADLLALRRRQHACFGPEGAYEPIRADGPGARAIVGFRRGDDVVVLVRRFCGQDLDEALASTTVELPPGRWRRTIPVPVERDEPAHTTPRNPPTTEERTSGADGLRGPERPPEGRQAHDAATSRNPPTDRDLTDEADGLRGPERLPEGRHSLTGLLGELATGGPAAVLERVQNTGDEP